MGRGSVLARARSVPSPAPDRDRETRDRPCPDLMRPTRAPRCQSEDEKAIRAVDDAFVRDYNQGDSKALAALFTEDAEVVEAEGDRYQGRDLIERRFAETFAASPGVKIAIEIESIRFLSPDVAKEEGRTVDHAGQGARRSRPYTVLFVKRDGRWLISSVREEATRWSARTTGSRTSNG